MIILPPAMSGTRRRDARNLLVLAAFIFTNTLTAQGKIQLKRPGAEPTPAAETTAPPAEVSLPTPTPATPSVEQPKPDAPAAGGLPTPDATKPTEKIALTKPADAAQAEADYSTSRGPESKSRTFYLGPVLGFNVSGLANGKANEVKDSPWEMSPVFGLRSELYFKRIYGIVADLAYEQNRASLLETPIAGFQSKALLRTDYMMLRVMFSYRYSLAKVFGKIKFMRPIADFLKPFAGNLQAGFFGKTPLSGQLEILGAQVGDPNDPYYDVKPYARTISGGFMGGLGFELRLASFIFFVEGQYFRGVLNTYDAIQSRYFNTAALSEQGVYISSGIKTGIYGF